MNNKMNKLKNYNQILLAIAGTMGVAFLIISGLFLIYEMMPRTYEEDGMLAIEETEVLAEKNLRKEIVSFGDPELIDSVNRVFVVPVYTGSLSQPETSGKDIGLYNKFSGDYSNELGTNNLVIYNEMADVSKIVFEKRLRISDYIIKEINGVNYLIIRGCEADSNKDGLLNNQDMQKLYFYDCSKGVMSKLEMPKNYTSFRLYNFSYLNHLILRFGVDRNGDGSFDRQEEPSVLMKINPLNSTSKHIVDKEQIELLQNTLEGK